MRQRTDGLGAVGRSRRAERRSICDDADAPHNEFVFLSPRPPNTLLNMPTAPHAHTATSRESCGGWVQRKAWREAAGGADTPTLHPDLPLPPSPATPTFTPLTRLARFFGAPALARPTRRITSTPPSLGTPGVVAAPAPARRSAHGSPRGAPAARGATSILWLRADLRLHDNAALTAACAKAGALLPVAVLDPRAFRRADDPRPPPPRAGPYRAKFLLAALADLRASLRTKQSDLIVCVGEPEDVLPRLARSIGARRVVCTSEPAYADAAVEAAVDTALAKHTEGRTKLERVWGGTLAEPSDLGGVAATPPTFAAFRARTAAAPAREPTSPPRSLPPLPSRSPPAGDLPSLEELIGDAATVAAAVGDGAAAGGALEGGETAGLAALARLVAASAASSATQAPPSPVAALAPWLAAGCLSPRRALADTPSTADRASTAAELSWRDFFRFTTAKLSAVRLGGRKEEGVGGGLVAA